MQLGKTVAASATKMLVRMQSDKKHLGTIAKLTADVESLADEPTPPATAADVEQVLKASNQVSFNAQAIFSNCSPTFKTEHHKVTEQARTKVEAYLAAVNKMHSEHFWRGVTS